ncbi:AraC family transcriptional regulator [Dactylosporangium sp. CA-233914]|uniref:helix-turn-helix transcriptional regulator n=1 Tax=Dactylosporangium sp. CA-233914 TaxID=3239934 RepID=UPI003D8E10E8
MSTTAVFRPPWVRAGFHAEAPAGLDSAGRHSGLVHAGEQWAPARFRIAPHTHPVWEFYLQVHGESGWLAGGTPFALGPGHLLGVAPAVSHHMRHESSAQHHFFFAAVDPAPVLARQPQLAADWQGLPPVVHSTRAHELAETFRQLCRELTTARRHARTGLVLAVDRLVLEVTRQVRDAHPAPVLAGHPAVAAARRLLERDSARRWRLGELSREVGLAPGYLAALFAAEVGVSPHRYLTEHRIRQARHLLATGDLPVTAIGLTVGFGSGQHFARVFRQVTGESPSEHRRSARPTGAASGP